MIKPMQIAYILAAILACFGQSHAESTCTQVELFQQCGGQSSAAGTNDADPALCCPSGSSCKHYNDWFWQCQPEGYTAPEEAPAAYEASCGDESDKVPLYGPCGGVSLIGLNASNPGSCCPTGSSCNFYNEYFWQCQPPGFVPRPTPKYTWAAACSGAQVKMWGECGGTLSAYRRNAADPGACCPINGVCNYVSTAHWQCQPKGWRAPASLQASYAPECSTDHLVSLWDAPCGGLDSPYRRNASDPAICCPLGSSCIYYNQLYWRCVPQHYTEDPSDPLPPDWLHPLLPTLRIPVAYQLPGLACPDLNLTALAASFLATAAIGLPASYATQAVPSCKDVPVAEAANTTMAVILLEVIMTKPMEPTKALQKFVPGDKEDAAELLGVVAQDKKVQQQAVSGILAAGTIALASSSGTGNSPGGSILDSIGARVVQGNSVIINPAVPQPPRAKAVPTELPELWGETRVDSYAWMAEDSPATQAHLAAENQYYASATARSQVLRQQLKEEMEARRQGRVTVADALPPPWRYKGHWYEMKQLLTEQSSAVLRQYYRREIPAGAAGPTISEVPDSSVAEELVLDESSIGAACEASDFSEGYAVCTTVLALPSGDSAWGLHVQALPLASHDLVSPLILSDPAMWWVDGSSLLLIRTNSVTGSEEVVLWSLASSSVVRVLYGEDFGCKLHLPMSRFYNGEAHDRVLLTRECPTSSEVLVIKLADVAAGFFTPLIPEQYGTFYTATYWGPHDTRTTSGYLYLIATDASTPNGELYYAPETNTTNTTLLMGTSSYVQMSDIELMADHLVVTVLIDGIYQTELYGLPGGNDEPSLPPPWTVQMPNDAAMYSFPATAYSSFPLLRVVTESFIAPVAFFDIQLDSLDMALKWMAPVEGAYEHWMYRSERVLVSADDGLQVPLSIMYKASTFQDDGSSSLVLSGYGAERAVIWPSMAYEDDIISMLDRGVVYAVAHVRGGGDSARNGLPWSLFGSGLNKAYSMRDYVDAAEYLITYRYTAPGRICLAHYRGTFGGLLVGYAITQHPELFSSGCAVLHAPTLDPIFDFQHFAAAAPSQPAADQALDLLTTELENPLPHEGAFMAEQVYQYMKTYAPYDQVKVQSYPAMLLTQSLYKAQQDEYISAAYTFWSGPKFAAKVRQARTDSNLVLVRTFVDELDQPSGTELVALQQAFMLDFFGLEGDNSGSGGSGRRLLGLGGGKQAAASRAAAAGTHGGAGGPARQEGNYVGGGGSGQPVSGAGTRGRKLTSARELLQSAAAAARGAHTQRCTAGTDQCTAAADGPVARAARPGQSAALMALALSPL